MTQLKLSYKHSDDAVKGTVVGIPDTASTRILRGNILFNVNSARSSVASFEVSGFSHFVDYYILNQIFGDDAIREIAAFQKKAAGQHRNSTQSIDFTMPARSKRVVADMLRAA